MESWQLATIGQVCEIKGGGTPSKAVDRYWTGDIPWVSPKDMKLQTVFDSIDHISAEAVSASAASMIEAGSILMVVRSGILARTVPIAVAGRALTVNQDIKVLCPRQDVDSWFLYYLLHAKMPDLLALVSRGATVHRLMTDQIRALEIELPPLDEQRRIVAILDEAFEGIATAKANAEANVRNAHDLFLTFHSDALARVREESESLPLGDLANFRNGINFTKQSKGRSVRIVGVKDFQDHFWAPMEELDTVTLDGNLSDSDMLVEGDILTVRSNGNPELIGRCILVGDVGESPVTHSGFTIRIRLQRRDVLPHYLCQFLKSQEVRRALVQGGNGVNIKSLNQGMLSEISVPIPPVKIQRKLIGEIEEMSEESDRLVALYERKRASLDELKSSMLRQAFNGHL